MKLFKKLKGKSDRGGSHPYVLHFLDHAQLAEIDASDAMHGPYCDLLRSKVDPVLFEHIEDPVERATAVDQFRMKRRVEAAVMLFKNGAYRKVAGITTTTGQDASRVATSVNIPWWIVAKAPVTYYTTPDRGLGSFDIVFRFDEPFLKMPLGYIDMQRRAYVDGYF